MLKIFLWAVGLAATLVFGYLVFGPNVDQGTSHGIAQAKTDINALETAVELFQKDNGRLPVALDELAARDHPLLARIPKNPWGTPYFYEETHASSGKQFKIWTIPSERIQRKLGRPQISKEALNYWS